MCSIQTKRQDIYIYKKFSCKQKTYSDIYFFLNRIRQKYLLKGQITWTNTLKIESIHIQRRTWKIFNIISLFIRTIQIISNSWELLELQKMADNTKCREDMEPLSILYITSGHTVWDCYFGAAIYQFLTKLSMQLYNLEVLLLGIYSRRVEIDIHTKNCYWMFIAALLIITKDWKYKCPSTGEQINQL